MIVESGKLKISARNVLKGRPPDSLINFLKTL
jgi:hypothetical protein